MVSGRSSSLTNVGSKDHQFVDADVVSLTQGPQSYESELGFYKEPQLEFATRVVFTFFDRIQNMPIAELEIELRNRQLRWIKPWTHYRTTPFDVVIELTQDLSLLQQLGSIAV